MRRIDFITAVRLGRRAPWSRRYGEWVSNIEVVHIPEAERYEIQVDGVVAGFTEAHPRDDGVVVFPHTLVDDAYEGQGLASILVTGALDDVRRRGLRIVVTCPYVTRFLRKHPEYQDLLAEAA
jgi:predicted GNAT family acetyltransferase